LYTALYSAQNCQSQLFDVDGFDQLGFYSNAIAYLGQGTGSVFCVFISSKIGGARSMAWASLFAFPFMISLYLPAYKQLYPDSDSVLLTDYFVYIVILVASLLNGLG